MRNFLVKIVYRIRRKVMSFVYMRYDEIEEYLNKINDYETEQTQNEGDRIDEIKREGLDEVKENQ